MGEQADDTEFQFQLGTIGTFLDASLVYTLSYFNSSQVRLEHTGLVFCIAFDEFQFQLGTIGTLCARVAAALAAISIPVRYDWNPSKQA